MQERACVKMPVQSNAGMPKHDKACAPQPQHKIKTIKKKKVCMYDNIKSASTTFGHKLTKK